MNDPDGLFALAIEMDNALKGGDHELSPAAEQDDAFDCGFSIRTFDACRCLWPAVLELH